MIKAGQDSLRDHNLSLLLTTLLHEGKALSRADLSKKTGLTKASVSLLTSLLLDQGVLEERSSPAASSVGRPSHPLGLAPRAMFGTGLQINTDGYGYSLISLDGHELAGKWVDQDMTETDPWEIFDNLKRLASPAISRLTATGVKMIGSTIALPGLVDRGRYLLSAANLGWGMLDLADFPLVRQLKARGDNEANLAAIAQIPGYATPAGVAQIVGPDDSFLYLSTDVGIGGAIVEHGQLYRGSHGFAGEVGHVSVSMDGPLCACGRRGCLEMYAGRRALVQAAGIANRRGSAEARNARKLVAAWKKGDPQARLALARGLRALVSVLMSLINVTDIPTVVLGGFWTHFDDHFAKDIRQRVQNGVLAKNHQKVRVFLAGQSAHPALLGAAEISLHEFVAHPAVMLSAAKHGSRTSRQ